MKIVSLYKESAVDIALMAKEVFEAGGIVAYPTDTLYGLGVDATQENAIEKLYHLKGRSNTPMSIMLGNVKDIDDYLCDISVSSHVIINKLLPGALTVVGTSKYEFSSLLLGDGKSVGIRVPNHELCQAMVQILGRPITTTSANLSGNPPALNIERIMSYFHDKIDLLIDNGTLNKSAGSTVLDIRNENPVLMREGEISRETIQLLSGAKLV